LKDLVTQPQMFFTARELAEIARAKGLTCFPQTEQGVRVLAGRNGWNDLGQNLARKRTGKVGGGGMEYHISLMPELLRMAYEGSVIVAGMTARLQAEHTADDRRIAALKASTLPARARKVMEARAEILKSIEGYAISQGNRRAWGVAQFLEAQAAMVARQEIEARRDRGEILTDREIASLARPLLLKTGFMIDPERIVVANDRRGKVGEVATISERTLWRWFKARDEKGVVALAPAATKEEMPIPPAFADFLRHYAKPGKPSIADAYGEYVKEAAAKDGVQLMTLTQSQVEYILRVRMNNIEKHVGREGMLTLRSRLPYVTRTTDDMWPATVYTADGKTFDAEIEDPVSHNAIRPEITTVMDIVTRKVVGISLGRSENQKSVAEALRRSCVTHGICAIFYVDRGPGYRNEAMDADVSGLMGRLGITKAHALPYGSQAKGRIERIQHTIWDTLAKRLPTYIGADMDKEAGDKIHKLTRREIREFGRSRALPSWAEFVKLCEDMVAEYNAKPHSSLPQIRDPETGKLRTMSPNECWEAHVVRGFEPVTVDPDEADDLFRPYEIRTTRRGEVLWNTNSYFDHALAPYHETKVMVGYDYHQADRVWVREFDVESGQPGKLICVARFMANAQRYFPVSFEQQAVENRAKGQLKRLERKIDAVEAERAGQQLVDMRAQNIPAAVFDMPAAEVVQVSCAVSIAPEEVASAPVAKRRTFVSDEALAAWALEHPQELKPNQIAVLRGCMNDSTARELFRMSGIDLEALRNLLRAVA